MANYWTASRIRGGLSKVRLGAHLAKKGAATFEEKNYSSIDEIVRAFLRDAHDLIQQWGVTFQLPLNATWQHILASTKAEPEPEQQSQAEGSRLMSMQELKSKEAAAAKHGFKVGVLVYEKNVGCKAGCVRMSA